MAMKPEDMLLQVIYTGEEEDVAYNDISLADLVRRLTNAQDSPYNMSLYFDFTNGDLEFKLKENE